MDSVMIKKRAKKRSSILLMSSVLLLAASLLYSNPTNHNFHSSRQLLSIQEANQKASQSSWCPISQCNNTPICAPCQQRYLFILSTSRAGSTTLLEMMNQLPSVRLSGENFNLMYNLKQIYTDYKLLREDPNKSWGAFYHEEIPEQSMSCSLQHVLNALNPVPSTVLSNLQNELALKYYNQDMILGAKMVTVQEAFLDEEGDTPLEELVNQATEFFSKMFPCSKFLINVRSDVSAQITSQTNLGWGDRGEERLILENQFLMQFAENMGHQATLLDMVQWREDVNVLNDVVSWLGFQHCQFSQLLHANDHGQGGYSEDRTVLDLGKECHFPNPKDATQIANAMAFISNPHDMPRQESQEDMDIVVVQEEEQEEEDNVEVAEDNRTLKGASARTHSLLDMMNNDLQYKNIAENDRTLVMENKGMTATSGNTNGLKEKKAVVQGRQSKEAASAISSYLAAMNRNADGN